MFKITGWIDGLGYLILKRDGNRWRQWELHITEKDALKALDRLGA
jgi:hypothetical protein